MKKDIQTDSQTDGQVGRQTELDSRSHLSAHLGQGGSRKHTSQYVACLADLLSLLLTNGLLEDASQANASALLSLKVALRPVMQQPAKPEARSSTWHGVQ